MDFPAPFGPSKPKISPVCTLNDTLSTAVSSSNRRTNPCTSMAGEVDGSDTAPSITPVAGRCLLESAIMGAIIGHLEIGDIFSLSFVTVPAKAPSARPARKWGLPVAQ